MTLRTFHMVFLLLVIMGADLFGGWAVREYRDAGDPLILVSGIASMVGGLGLAAYVLWLIHKMDNAKIQ